MSVEQEYTIQSLPRKDAHTINAYWTALRDDNYHALIGHSAAILVSNGYGDADYQGGWRNTTLWSHGKRMESTIMVHPATRDIRVETQEEA